MDTTCGTAMSQHLALFAERHGFDVTLLTGDDPYRIEGVRPGFDGRIEAVRLTEHGRFGNIFYQLLHAVLLARQLGAGTIEVFSFTGGPAEGRHMIDGLTFEVGHAPGFAVPTLVGHFFNSFAFQSALTGYPASLLTGVVDRVMRPLFGHLAAGGAPTGADTVVLNLRGGDVFAAVVAPSWYVQPPASYHVRAALFAREAFGVSKAVLVSEDDGNPAGAIVRAQLEQARMVVASQSRSFAEDVGLMLNAVHLVSPFGTLCEALGMLSRHLRSYTAFRQFESHRHLHMRRPSVPLTVLHAHRVTPIRIVDRAMSYIPPLGWDLSEAQLDLLCRFPIDRLHIDIPDDAADDACFTAFAPSPVTPAAAEAYALRRRLIDVAS